MLFHSASSTCGLEPSGVVQWEHCERKYKGNIAPQNSLVKEKGIRQFKVAGRPSKEDFIAVYGHAGPKMTWEQRAAAGIPAEKFQAALASAMRK